MVIDSGRAPRLHQSIVDSLQGLGSDTAMKAGLIHWLTEPQFFGFKTQEGLTQDCWPGPKRDLGVREAGALEGGGRD